MGRGSLQRKLGSRILRQVAENSQVLLVPHGNTSGRALNLLPFCYALEKSII
jgi:hypothetical protein